MDAIPDVLWVLKMTPSSAIGQTPFKWERLNIAAMEITLNLLKKLQIEALL